MLTTDRLMTAEEFDALPDDPNVERMLIRGVLWEKQTVTRRNKWHSSTEALVAYWLIHWIRGQSNRSLVVASGEVGCLLRTNPPSRVGIDVALFPPGVAQLDVEDDVYFNGPPLLAAEILSPSDKQEEIQAKVDEYLASGVKLVWIIDTHFRTVVVHRPDGPPEMFHGDEDLVGDPHLPGLAIKVQQLFSR